MFNFNSLKSKFSDSSEEGGLNFSMKKMQGWIGFVTVLILMVVFFVFSSLFSTKPIKPVLNHKKTDIDGVLSTDFVKKNEISALEKQQQTINHLEAKIKDMESKNNLGEEKSSKERSEIIAKINGIIEKKEGASHPAMSEPFQDQAGANHHFHDAQGHQMVAMSGDGAQNFAPRPSVETMSFSYKKPPAHTIRHIDPTLGKKSAKNWVPAGTFARSVLLEGADANASVNGQSSTSPILVRILNRGTLPNGHHSNLKGCFVLASMYGDISSERGEARLTTISCTRKDGTIMEQKVKGYLSFAGKEGIKGTPVMRNGKILEMAGLSGLLGGFGSAMQQSTQAQAVSPLGVTTAINPNQVLQGGLYGGVNTAMSQLASYYVKRADQYHPIIEIGSGTIATVIFQEGFSLKDEENSKNNSSSTQHYSSAPFGDNVISKKDERSSLSQKSLENIVNDNQALSQRFIKNMAPFSNIRGEK